ncbi:hypothetical protein FQR65_LT14869 [Abscondita terminalis]|nr:hypothetical protein FQR65_LT14869 [Abscondita terminalis]
MGLSHAKCLSNARLDGKTAIVTGSNSGIGKCTVEDFFKRGARVIMACRNVAKANEAAENIKTNCDGQDRLGDIVVTELDLCSLESVKQCASRLLESQKQIDILVNNAGVSMCPKSKTVDGFETQFGTNHLGHFLFTLLLLPRIIESSPARIINVSSMVHSNGALNFDDLNYEKRQYSYAQAYRDSKLANVLFTKELARKLQEANIAKVTVYSLHPGAVATDLVRHLDDTYFKGVRWTLSFILRTFMKTPEQGAQTTIHCAVDETAGKETGLYYSECQVQEPVSKANSVEDAQKLWELSMKFVNLPQNYNPFFAKQEKKLIV